MKDFQALEEAPNQGKENDDHVGYFNQRHHYYVYAPARKGFQYWEEPINRCNNDF
jgi:hypothetical protein